MNRIARTIYWLRTAPARFEQYVETADADLFFARVDRVMNAVFIVILVLFIASVAYNVLKIMPQVPEGF